MTSLAPARDLARRLGASLGLTEGLDGPTSLRMSPRAYRTFVDALRELEVMNSDQGARSLAEFGALYLPSFLRTFFNNPVDAFNAIHPRLFDSYLSFLGVHVIHGVCFRFTREHQAEAIEFRRKTLQLLADWLDRPKKVSELTWADQVTDMLVRLYRTLSSQEFVARDDSPSGESDPLRLPPGLQSTLRALMPRLRSLQARLAEEDREKYGSGVDLIRDALSPESYQPARGLYGIAVFERNNDPIIWWTCEAKSSSAERQGSVGRCDGSGKREDLRVCSRCLAVRYCSERHQKLHCVAPTW